MLYIYIYDPAHMYFTKFIPTCQHFMSLAPVCWLYASLIQHIRQCRMPVGLSLYEHTETLDCYCVPKQPQRCHRPSVCTGNITLSQEGLVSAEKPFSSLEQKYFSVKKLMTNNLVCSLQLCAHFLTKHLYVQSIWLEVCQAWCCQGSNNTYQYRKLQSMLNVKIIRVFFDVRVIKEISQETERIQSFSSQKVFYWSQLCCHMLLKHSAEVRQMWQTGIPVDIVISKDLTRYRVCQLQVLFGSTDKAQTNMHKLCTKVHNVCSLEPRLRHGM